MVDVDEGGENGENTSDIMVGNGDGETENGDVTQDGGLGVSAAQSQASRPDTDHRGQELVSGEQAFLHSLLSVGEAGVATPNQLNHFAIISRIREKPHQRNTLYTFVVRKLERFKQKADKAGFLEEDDVKRAKDAVTETKEDVKNTTLQL